MKTPSSRPQRYALVTETYPPEVNGVANTLGRLCEGLLQHGHQVELVRPAQTGEYPGRDEAGHLSEQRVLGLPLPRYTELQVGRSARRLLTQLWTRQRPDSIYIATEGPLGWSALRAARRLEIPVVSGFHTNFHQYTEHYGLGMFGGAAGAYLRWFHNQSTLTLTASLTQQNELARLGIQNLAMLGRGVDAERFHPRHRDAGLRRSWQAGEQDLVLLYVGRLASEKNLDLLVHSWRAVSEQRVNNEGRVRLVMAGAGPLRRKLERQLPDAIFTGSLTGPELARLYASADIFLFPSLTETFGNVVLEAMASGLAVNAFDLAAANQHISDRYSGCVATAADEHQFLDNLQWLMADVEGLRGVRLHARHSACQLTWDGIIQRFAGYLQKAAATRSSAAAIAPAGSRPRA
ncbi:glycosyltransferase family 1 protein [Halopseudomonas nanhaiensis]|uniref:glycosyltransferase family 4 protein n=1 Tax=Halopseudomonas nanhaiensis TaxID=2830842 RepID=UPI001CBC2A97|nr:glycosyltransferase family 1 protein [Halopseudomonas nanhaiensis]UAW98947.1 glycosyltransferase family 1 protein [Halopseudomonas nanhaiensis]